MNIEEVRKYCSEKKGVTEGFPFDETTFVFKVGGKMFALLSLEGNNTINLKCDPERAIELRERYNFITGGYHMSKKHWNTIAFIKSSEKLTKDLIDHSYNLIYNKLPKKVREEIDVISL